MKKDEDRKPKRPFAYPAKGVATNMVYDDSGQVIVPWPASPKPDRDDDGNNGPAPEPVSTTMPE